MLGVVGSNRTDFKSRLFLADIANYCVYDNTTAVANPWCVMTWAPSVSD